MCPFMINKVIFRVELFHVTSQASSPIIEPIYALPSAIEPLPTLPTPIDDQPMHPLPIFGPKKASVATMFYHTLYSVSTPSETGVMLNLLCILDTPPMFPIKSIQIDLMPIVEIVVNPIGYPIVAAQEPPKTKSPSEVQNISL